MTRTTLYLGCTRARHARLGIHAVINARAGRPDLNDLTLEDVELERDARAIRLGYQRAVSELLVAAGIAEEVE